MINNPTLYRSFGVFLIFLSLTHWFTMDIQVLELLSAFPHFTLGLSLLFLSVSIWKRYAATSLLAFIPAFISGLLIVPYISPTPVSSQPTDLTIGQFNVYHFNDDPEKMTSEILETDVDVISVQELNSRWSSKVHEELTKTHPHFIEEYWDTCCYGIGLYSKYPIGSYKIHRYANIPLICAEIEVKDRLMTIVSVHTQAPAFPDRTDIRNAQIDMATNMVTDLKTPHIVLGDLNIVPWDRVFKRFLKNTELQLVRGGFQATFPMDLGVPLIPIDHILYSKGLEPTYSETVYIPGSDHKGVVAGFHLN